MQCKKCMQSLEENSKFCNQCGYKVDRKFSKFKVILLLVVVAVLFFFVGKQFSGQQVETANEEVKTEIPKEKTKKVEPEPLLDKQDEKTRTEIIEHAQQTVYTVFTDMSQGSAFLYDQNGSVVTNAHVLEGSVEATIKTIDGEEYTGTVIGYSNETDVAVIDVPALKGQKPFPIEKTEVSKVGQEVIALGTPLGLENTATMGYITGTERDLVIPASSFKYENVYQISAPIEPGNSGGPLVSINDEKIVAINSAKSTQSASIGFSIPLYQVTNLIDSWIQNPMNEEDIYALFYNEDGSYYYDYLWSFFEDFYFDGGYYTDEELYYYFWEYYDGYWDEYYLDDWYYYWDDEDYDEYDYYWDDEDYDDYDYFWDDEEFEDYDYFWDDEDYDEYDLYWDEEFDEYDYYLDEGE